MEKSVTTAHQEAIVPRNETMLAGIGKDEDETLNNISFVDNFPEEKRKAVVRKIDWRLPPFLACLYLIAYLDRSNIANAKIEGMLEDLDMDGLDYNIALSTFFITYILFEIPSNYILERYFTYRPSLWIGSLCVGWGIMMTLHGIVQNFRSLVTLRLIMGVFESGFFPAAVLMMNKWYLKFELSSRVSIYYAGAAVSGAFSGLLAYALAKMDGISGVAGWRWIFIIEGIVTVVIGVVVLFALVDTPNTRCSWLTEDEQKYCRLRLENQDGGKEVHAKGQTFSWKLLWTVLTDWQFYPMALIFWSNTVPGYGLKFSMPQIIKNMGFTSSKAQLMTIPPYFCGAVSAYTFGRLSDKFRRRSYFLLIPQSFLVIGFAILFPLAPKIQDNIGVCYFAVIVVCIGLYPIQPGGSAWISNNLAGPAKRAIGLAYAFTLTNCGALGGSYIYIQSEAPSYPTGFGCSLGFALGAMVAVVFLDVVYHRINKKRDQMSIERIRMEYSDERLAELGDRSPLFRYVL